MSQKRRVFSGKVKHEWLFSASRQTRHADFASGLEKKCICSNFYIWIARLRIKRRFSRSLASMGLRFSASSSMARAWR